MKLLRIVVISMLVWVALPVVHAEARPRIERLSSVSYGRSDSVDLAYDVVRPVAGGKRAAVVLLHGGGWWSGSRIDLTERSPLAQAIARAGFVAIIPDYRLACGSTDAPRRSYGLDYTTNGPRCGAHLDEQVNDVLDVVRHVRERAGTLHVDPSRIGILGVSAGGHLAMLAAERAPADARIRAVVNVSGPMATGFVRRQIPRPRSPMRTIRASFTNAVGCHPSICPARWRAADPTAQLGRLPRSTRVLAIAGVRETQVPVSTMYDFQRRAARIGRQVDVVAGPGGCHGTGCLYSRQKAISPSPLAQTRAFLRDVLG